MFYHRLGQIPAKRHTQFRRPDGGLYSEQVMGVHGFAGIQSILYHTHPPTQIKRVELLREDRPEYVDFGAIRHRHFLTKEAPAGGDAVTGRRVILGNEDVSLALARPTESMSYFYRNGQSYECIFVAEGRGSLHSIFGRLDFEPGDYIVIPYSVTWQMRFQPGPNRLLVIESRSQISSPDRYRNTYGQHLEHSPYCERDFRPGPDQPPHPEPPSLRCRRLGWLCLSLDLQHPRLRAHYGAHSSAAAGAPDL